MASEDKPDITDEVLVTSAEELTGLIRNEFQEPDPPAKVSVQRAEAEDTRTEPEVMVEGESRPSHEVRGGLQRPSRTSEDVQPMDDDRKAILDRLEAMERRNQDLEREIRQGPRVQNVPDRTANIEMIEVLPGVAIPKDPKNRFVNLPPEFYEKVAGLDPQLADAFNMLGNVFFHSIQDMFMAQAMSGFEYMQEQRVGAHSRRNEFFSANRDLVGQEDLVTFIEGRARAEGVHMGRSQQEYGNEITKRVRGTLARMRGISYDQYMDKIRTNNPAAAPRQSRAISGARPTRTIIQRSPQAASAQQELDAVNGF